MSWSFDDTDKVHGDEADIDNIARGGDGGEHTSEGEGGVRVRFGKARGDKEMEEIIWAVLLQDTLVDKPHGNGGGDKGVGSREERTSANVRVNGGGTNVGKGLG